MCTIQEIKDLIHEELFNPKEDGKSRLSREIENHIDMMINQLFWRLIKWIGTSMIVLTISATVAWSNLNYSVEKNTDFRTQGDRFTQQDGENLQQQIDQAGKRQDSLENWLIRIEAKLDAALR